MEEPVQVLASIQRMRTLGAMLEHNQGANYITASQFTLLFWNIFHATMQDWLQEDQNLDPFDAANPIDHDNIADHMQHYWNIHFKHTKRIKGKNRGRTRERMEMTGMIMKKSARPRASVEEINATTRSK